MSIYPEKNRRGVLTGRFVVEVVRAGKTHKARTTSIADARHLEASYKAGLVPSLPAASPALPKAYTLDDLRRDNLRRINGQDDGTQTLKRLETCISILGRSTDITTIRARDLDKLVDTLKTRNGRGGKPLDNKTVNRYLAALQGCFSWAHSREILTGMPLFPKLPESKGRVAYVAEEHEQAMWTWLEAQGQDAVVFAIRVLTLTGMRRGEFLSLSLDNLEADQEGPYIYLWEGTTKNNDGRKIPIPPDMVAPLRAYLSGPPISYDRLRYWLEAARKHCRVPLTRLTPHVLRHTFGTRLNAKGAGMATIQSLMGHRAITTTAKYVHGDRRASQAATRRLWESSEGT